MSPQRRIIHTFKMELKEIREECCLGRNFNYLYAQLIALLNNYAQKTEALTYKEQQQVWRNIYRQLSPGMFVLSKEWREICKCGRIYMQKYFL